MPPTEPAERKDRLTTNVEKWVEQFDNSDDRAVNILTPNQRSLLVSYLSKHPLTADDQTAEIEKLRAENVRLTERAETLSRKIGEAQNYLEGPIAMRTAFDGEPPYIGWKGLGKAMEEAFDERDKFESRIKELEQQVAALEQELAEKESEAPNE